MEEVLKLNEQSHLLEELDNAIPVDRTFEQKIKKNIPNFVKTQKTVRPIFRDRDLDKYIFELPNDGFLLGLCFETTLTSDGDNSELEEGPGSRIFSNIYLKQFNKVLAENCPSYIEARIDDLPSSTRSSFTEMIDTDKTFNNNSVVTYTPLFFSFTDKAENAILLNYYRNLEIEATRSTESELGLDASLTDFETKLIVFVGYLSDAYYNSYLYNVFTGPEMSIFSYDKYVKKYPLTTSSTNKSVIFDLKALIFAFHIILKDNTAAVRKINDLDIFVNNKKVTSTNKRLNYFDSGRHQNEIANHQGSHTFSYYFGLEKSRHYHTGAINTAQTDDVRIEVTYDTIPANFELIITAEYYTILTADRLGRLDRKIIF